MPDITESMRKERLTEELQSIATRAVQSARSLGDTEPYYLWEALCELERHLNRCFDLVKDTRP